MSVVPPNQDKEILQAILEALKEKGVRADVAWEHDIVGIPFEELIHHNGAEGWKELFYFQPTMAEFLTSRGIAEMPPGRTVRTAHVAR